MLRRPKQIRRRPQKTYYIQLHLLKRQFSFVALMTKDRQRYGIKRHYFSRKNLITLMKLKNQYLYVKNDIETVYGMVVKDTVFRPKI
jgi:hypothetical protein